MNNQRLKKISRQMQRAVARFSHPPIVGRVRRAGLTFLDWAALTELHTEIRSIEKQGITGQVIEAGCALGGSAIVMADAKTPLRPLRVYDVFDMIPPPSDKDDADVHQRYEIIKSGRATGPGGQTYYGYLDNLRSRVAISFREMGLAVENNAVELIEGRFEDTLHPTEPVALAHIDGDWYESVRVCLERITPQLAVGGRLVIDDYDDWSGCRAAVDEYFATRRADFHFVGSSRLHIVRVNPAK